MRLEIFPDGSGDLGDLARRLATLDRPITTEPDPATGGYAVQIGRSGVVPLANAVAAFVAERDVAVMLRDEAGTEARVDRKVATNPFELLMVVNLFNPPVGLG